MVGVVVVLVAAVSERSSRFTRFSFLALSMGLRRCPE